MSDMPTLSDALKNSPFPAGSTAASVVSELDDLFDLRAVRLAKIQQMYDRKPPLSQEKLRESGQSYRVNVNTGELEALVDDITATATQSIMAARPVISLKAQGIPVEVRKKIASQYHDLLYNSKSFSWFNFVDKVNLESTLYAFGVSTFRGRVDWRPNWQPHFEFRPGEDSSPDSREMGTFALHTRVQLDEFFSEVDFDPDVVAQDWYKGWNIPELRKFLVDQINGNVSESNVHYTNDYLEMSQSLRDGTGWALRSNVRFRKVKLTHLYAKHPKTGRVCHYILSGEPPVVQDKKEISPDTMHPESPESGILYYSEGDYQDFTEILWLLAYNYGPSTLLAVRGVGHRAYPHADLSNRFFCASVDGGFMAASVMITAPETDAHGRIPIVRAGPLTIAPAGWTATPQNFAPNFQHLISLRQMSTSVMHNNLGTYNRRQESPLASGGEKSAAEINMLSAQQTEANQNRATYRQTQWAALHREIFRRMTDKVYLAGTSVEDFEALVEEHAGDTEKILDALGGKKWEAYRKEVVHFYIALVMERIPLAVLFDRDWTVQAAQGVGSGSRSDRLSALTDVMSLVSSEPRGVQDRLRHAIITERTGNPDFADEMIDLTRVSGDSRDSLLVVLENNDMKEGRDIPVPSDVDHPMHFINHVQLFFRDVEAWQAQPMEKNTREAYALGVKLVPHLAGHLEYISRDPMVKGQLEDFVSQFQKVQQMTLVIEKMASQVVEQDQMNRDQLAQEIAELRARADDTQGKLMLKAKELESNIALRNVDMQSQVANRAAKTQGAQQVKQAAFMGDEQRKQQSHILRMEKTLQELQAENQKLQLEIEKARAQTEKVRNEQRAAD